MVWRFPAYLGDAQDTEPSGRCEVCRGELYGDEAEPDEWGRVLCPECREEQDSED